MNQYTWWSAKRAILEGQYYEENNKRQDIWTQAGKGRLMSVRACSHPAREQRYTHTTMGQGGQGAATVRDK